MLLARMVDKVN